MRAGFIISVALLSLAGSVLPCPAGQDSKPQSSRVPRLTTDDVAGARSQPSATGEAADGPSAYAAAGMSRYSPGNMGISLELPAEPRPMPGINPLPPNKLQLKEMHKYLSTSGPMSVLVASVTFHQPQSPSQFRDFQAAFMTSVREEMMGPFRLAAKRQGAAPNPVVQFSEIGDVVSVSAKFSVGGRDCVQSGLLEERGSQFLAVVASHFANDEKAKSVAQRVLASVYFQ